MNRRRITREVMDDYKEETQMRILREETVGVIIDVQEKLVPVINKSDEVVAKIKQLVEGLEILEVPLVVTQQYTKGLGETIEPIKKEFYNFNYFEKISFSCVDDKEIMKKIKDIHKKDIIVAGIESHICVLQTVIDLKQRGFSPIVAVDAVGSRNELDKKIALERMAFEGVSLTTVESILFELVRFAGNKKFKEISKLVK